MTRKFPVLAIAAMLPLTASAAGKLACKASVQDGHGIATAWITLDAGSVVPTKASFVFPPGRVAANAQAGGYVLGKPPQLPENTLLLLAQFDVIANGNNLRIGLNQVEIDGPAYLRKDLTTVDPLFVLTTDGKSVVTESAVRDGEIQTLRLHAGGGKSTAGDIYMEGENRTALSNLFDHGDLSIAAGDLHFGKPVYQAVIPMTDSKTIQTMLVAAMKKAAASAPAGCQSIP